MGGTNNLQQSFVLKRNESICSRTRPEFMAQMCEEVVNTELKMNEREGGL